MGTSGESIDFTPLHAGTAAQESAMDCQNRSFGYASSPRGQATLPKLPKFKNQKAHRAGVEDLREREEMED